MEKKKRLILCGLFVLSIILVSPSAFAIGTPTIISPKTPYGSSSGYYTMYYPSFSWTAVAGATWYQIWVGKKATPHTAAIDQWVEAGTTWRSNIHLTPGTVYSWWVRAWNSTEGFGDWSNKGDFTCGRIHHMSINADTFIPSGDGYQWTFLNGGQSLENKNGVSELWGAPVVLPDGAVVKKVWLYYYNKSATTGPTVLVLKRSAFNFHNTDNDMATCTANAAFVGDYYAETSAITYPVIDNDHFSYYLALDLPTTNNYLIHAQIDYWY